MGKTNIIIKLLLVTLFLLSINSSQSAVILKINNNQSLIHLEGLKTKKGSYFEALDLYGNSKGLIQIKRVGNKKAIGILKLGKMALKYSLEPKSKKWAWSKMRKYKTALIQRHKRKRKLSSQKKKRIKRQVASYPEGEEYLADDSQFTFNDSYDSENEELPVDSSPANFAIGIQPLGSFNFMKISPAKSNSIFLKGFGFGGRLFVESSVNKFLSTGGHVGYQRYSVKSEDKCGSSRACSLEIDYLTAGLNLKSHFVPNKSIKLSAGLNGTIFYPINYINRANISLDSFGFHGTLGLVLGVDLSFGNLFIPISISPNLIIPPTATTLLGVTNLSLGIGYKF